uniref:Putative leucinetRNA ligase n=1 Tax=Rhizophora mucronata TaxID=61149 RepID=A0A2P2MC77_RHIMU
MKLSPSGSVIGKTIVLFEPQMILTPLSPSIMSLTCSLIPVELGYMLDIHWDILLQTFLLGLNVCRVTMFCTQWDGMPLVCLLSNMQLRLEPIPRSQL